MTQGIENSENSEPNAIGSLPYLISILKVKIGQLPEEVQNLDIQEFDMSVRLSNVFRRENVHSLRHFCSFSAQQISKWQGLGETSIRHFQLVLDALNIDAYLKRASLLNSLPLFQDSEALNYSEDYKSFAEDRNRYGESTIEYYIYEAKKLIVNLPDKVRQTNVGELDIPVRLQNVFKKQSVNTLGDLLAFSEQDIKHWPSLGKKSVSQLCEMLVTTDIVALERRLKAVEDYQNGVVDSSANDDETLHEAFVTSISKIEKDSHRLILEARLGINSSPKTLEETGVMLGVTRERIRQLQKKMVNKIIKGESWDDLLGVKVRHLMATAKKPLFIDELYKNDAWFTGFENEPHLLLNIIELFSHTKVFNLMFAGRLVLSSINYDTWQTIRQNLEDMFEYSVDLEYTIDDVEMLIEAELSKFKAKELASLMFDDLYPELIFSNIRGELILTGVGSTKGKLIRAILEEAETPLHFEVIASLYNKKFGTNLRPRNIHAGLNNHDHFLLFDRGIYGLSKHLKIEQNSRDEILCAGELVVNSNTAKQWHSSEILIEILNNEPHLRSKELTKYTLSAILSSSKTLRYLGKMVWAFETLQASDTERLQIKKAICDILRHCGRPMRIDELQDELTKIRSVGKDLAFTLTPNNLFSKLDPATWGLLDRDFILTDKRWSEIKDILIESLNLRKQAFHITELVAAIGDRSLLRKLTDYHVLGIMMGDSRFKTWRGNLIGLSEWKIPNRLSFAESMQLIANEAGSSIRTEEIVDKALMLVGHDFHRNLVSIHMNRNGFTYDLESKLWLKAS